MSLPASWVDRIFTKLTVRYGVAFTRQYEGVDTADVKADWAEVLGGFSADAIGYALRFLPTERPPTALQFREICRRAPAPEAPPQLEGPKPDPARLAELMQRMRKATAMPAAYKRAGRESAEEVGNVFAGFNPIPPELCPWNQRKDAA